MNAALLTEYASLCGIAYESADMALSTYKSKGYEVKVLNQPLKLEQVFALRKDGKLFIVITGTNQLRDWLVNILAIPGQYLHSGYGAIATALIGPVLSEYESSKADELVILGHSKGGGVAAILGYYVSHLPTSVVTYGAPRIASVSYAAAYPSEMYTRVVHAHDLVARLPAQFTGYRYCGKPVVWDGQKYDDTLKAWIDAQKNHPTWSLILNLSRAFKSHMGYWL
jgi:hypothetical protein